MKQLLSLILLFILSFGLFMSTSCVKYTVSSYEEVSRKLTSGSTNVIVQSQDGVKHDLLVTEISRESISGYRNDNESGNKIDIPLAEVQSLSKKEKTILAKVGSSIGKGVVYVVGVSAVILVVFKYKLFDDDDEPYYAE